MQDLFKSWLKALEEDDESILFARAEGISWSAIATDHEVSLSTARARYARARGQLQKALDREQQDRRARGLAVFPITLEQLMASMEPPPPSSAEVMQKIWDRLDPLMAEDIANGTLGDDGTDDPSPWHTPLTDAAIAKRRSQLAAVTAGSDPAPAEIPAPSMAHDSSPGSETRADTDPQE